MRFFLSSIPHVATFGFIEFPFVCGYYICGFEMMKIPPISTAQEFNTQLKNEFWTEIAAAICQRHKVFYSVLRRAEGSENVVFLIDNQFVLKIFTPFRTGEPREIAALDFARGKTSVGVPEIVCASEFENFKYLITTQMSGAALTRADFLNLEREEQTEIVLHLAEALKQLHSHDAPPTAFDWQKFIEHQVETTLERQRVSGATAEWLASLPAYFENYLKLLPIDFKPMFIHGDVHFGNLLFVKTSGLWKISALFDFADSLVGFREYEFVAVGVLMLQGDAELQREFFRAYGYKSAELDENLRRRLMLLTILYECSSLRRYAIRLKPQAVDFTLDRLERAIWAFAD